MSTLTTERMDELTIRVDEALEIADAGVPVEMPWGEKATLLKGGAREHLFQLTEDQAKLVRLLVVDGADALVGAQKQVQVDRLRAKERQLERAIAEVVAEKHNLRKQTIALAAAKGEYQNTTFKIWWALLSKLPRTMLAPSLPKLLWAGVVDAVQAFLSPSQARSLLQQDDAPDAPQPSQSERRTRAARTIG